MGARADTDNPIVRGAVCCCLLAIVNGCSLVGVPTFQPFNRYRCIHFVSEVQMKFYPSNLTPVWGIQEIKPLRDWPEGKIRIRLRNKDVGWGFVRNGETITQYMILKVERDGQEYWIPGMIKSVNHVA